MSLFVYKEATREHFGQLLDTFEDLKIPLTVIGAKGDQLAVIVPDELEERLRDLHPPIRVAQLSDAADVLSEGGLKYYRNLEAAAPEKIYFHDLTPPLTGTKRGLFLTDESRVIEAEKIISDIGGYSIPEPAFDAISGEIVGVRVNIAIPEVKCSEFIRAIAKARIAGYSRETMVLWNADDFLG